MNNFPSDYVRRSELTQLLDVMSHQKEQIDHLTEALDRTLRIIEKMQAVQVECIEKYNDLVDSFEVSVANIDSDLHNIASSVIELSGVVGYDTGLFERDENGERIGEESKPVEDTEQADELVYVSADKKVLH